jgi:hypothetical protein
MKSKKYYLYLRGGIWYCRLIDPSTGKPLTARSTGKYSRQEAEEVAISWLYGGVPQKYNKEVKQDLEVHAVIETFKKMLVNKRIPSDELSQILSLASYMYGSPVSVYSRNNQNKTELPQQLPEENTPCVKKNDAGDNRPSPSFVDYTLTFWDWKHSPYIASLREEGVQEKLLPGKTRFQKIHYMLQKRLFPYFKNMPLAAVTAKEINKFLVSLLGSLKLGSLKKMSEWLQQTVKFAYKADLLATDISAQIHPPKGEEEIKPILTIDQSVQLFATIDNFKNKMHYCINKLALETACRIGEVAALKISDIRFHDSDKPATVCITKNYHFSSHTLKDTKNKSHKEVPISLQLTALLKDFIETHPQKDNEDAFLFYNQTKSDRPIGYDSIRKEFIRVMKTLGFYVPHLTIHSYRHLAAVILWDKGYSERDIMMITGHKSFWVLRHYCNHETQERKAKKLEMSRVIAQAITSETLIA